jgi:hypothetical protein
MKAYFSLYTSNPPAYTLLTTRLQHTTTMSTKMFKPLHLSPHSTLLSEYRARQACIHVCIHVQIGKKKKIIKPFPRN